MKKILLSFRLLASVCDASTLAKVLEIKAEVDAIKQVLTEKNIPFTNLSDIANSLDSNLPVYSGGDGTASDPFLVSTTSHFLAIGSGDVVGGASGSWDMDKHYKQVADIDFDGVVFTPVGHEFGTGYTAFTGSYDGNGYEIHNVSFTNTGSTFVGLFCRTEGATIKNIGLVNPNITGWNVVGGLIGTAESSTQVSKCYVVGGDVTATRTDTATTAGGLVGYARGGSTIEDCYARTSVSGVGAAGFVVLLATGGSVENCWTASTVSGGSNNAFVTSGTAITNCYYNTDIFPTSTSGTGLTTADMYKQASYNDWDFIDTWQINEDASYPYFQAPYPVQSPAPAE